MENLSHVYANDHTNKHSQPHTLIDLNEHSTRMDPIHSYMRVLDRT